MNACLNTRILPGQGGFSRTGDLSYGQCWLVDAPWDAYIAAPGDAPTLRETTFGGGRGLLSFRVDDDAEMIHVFAITWIG